MFCLFKSLVVLKSIGCYHLTNDDQLLSFATITTKPENESSSWSPRSIFLCFFCRDARAPRAAPLLGAPLRSTANRSSSDGACRAPEASAMSRQRSLPSCPLYTRSTYVYGNTVLLPSLKISGYFDLYFRRPILCDTLGGGFKHSTHSFTRHTFFLPQEEDEIPDRCPR